MEMLILGLVVGMIWGYSIRTFYNLFTGKDIRLFKFPYTIHKDGSVEELKL